MTPTEKTNLDKVITQYEAIIGTLLTGIEYIDTGYSVSKEINETIADRNKRIKEDTLNKFLKLSVELDNHILENY